MLHYHSINCCTYIVYKYSPKKKGELLTIRIPPDKMQTDPLLSKGPKCMATQHPPSWRPRNPKWQRDCSIYVKKLYKNNHIKV